MVLKRVGAASLAKIAGTLYLMLGFIIGAIVSLVSILGLAAKPNDESAVYGLLFGAGAVILFSCVLWTRRLCGRTHHGQPV